MSSSSLTIADLGEQRLLKLLQSYSDAQINGDDAAVLRLKPGHSVVVTTDVLVEDVHFSDRTTPPHAVGWRAVAANLSDLAAMGATGLGITVALSLPSDCPVAWLKQVYQGMQDCLVPHGLAIVGGDVSRSRSRSLAITALGQVQPAQQIRRDAAQVGDAIVVTGSHGGSRAGLALLLNSEDSSAFRDEAGRAQLIQRHQYPCPRLDCVVLLNELSRWNALEGRAIAGMDSSDGLADAVLQLCRASGVGAIIQADKIPLPSALRQWQTPQLALEWSLYGGEDFELVLCMPEAIAHAFCARLPGAATIGRTTADSKVALDCSSLLETAGDVVSTSPISLELEQGFQHFS